MSILTVNLGNYANDGTGDDLRTAFEKVNSNFSELDLTRIISAENLGSGAPIFLGKEGTVLLFRSIKGGQNVEVSYTDNELTISTVNLLAKIEQDLEPKLGGDLDLNGFDIKGSGSINLLGVVEAPEFRGEFQGNLIGNVAGNLSGNVLGNVTGTVSDISNHQLSDLGDVDTVVPNVGQALVWSGTVWRPGNVESTSSIGNNYDFGIIGVSSTDPLQLVLQFTNINFGTFNAPSTYVLDMGGIDPTAVYYFLSKNKTNVEEGSSITITLQTTNLNNGTVIPYQITGVTSEDINGLPLTGNFVINNNKSTLVIFASIDAELEISETVTITLSNIIPETSISFNIVDSSSDIDGGSPSTINFLGEIDGGSPSTTFFSSLIDGGSVLSESEVNGGNPSSTFISTIDGGIPSTITFDEIIDGGIIV
jgi:hypothetical protein